MTASHHISTTSRIPSRTHLNINGPTSLVQHLTRQRSIGEASIIPINLISHNHHPKQEDGPDQHKTPSREPGLTNTPLHEPSEGIEGLAADVVAVDVEVAVAVDGAGGAPELHGVDDEADEPEDEEDEGAHDDDAREERAVVDQVEEE